MRNFMNFSANVQNAFHNDASEYASFSELLLDAARGTTEVSKKAADAKIVEIFNNVLGITKESTPMQRRQALRAHQAECFSIIEETVQSLLITDWAVDPFFTKYVDVRNLALGDRNEFFVDDQSILEMMQISGNHWNLIRQRLGAGQSTSITTSWIGAKHFNARTK